MDELMVMQTLIGAGLLVAVVVGIWLFGRLCDRYEKRLAERCPHARAARDNNDIDCQADLTDFDGGED